MTNQEYNKCVNQYADALYGFAYKFLKDSFEAENVVQNTFEKLWVRIDQVETATVKSFIYKIAYNNAIDIIRKSKRSAGMSDAVADTYSHSDQYNDIMEVVQNAVKLLPEKQRAVIMLRDYEGYDYKSIGEITSMTEAQVKINIFRARQFLKNHLKDIHAVL